MATTPRISDSEWQVMEVLWKRSPLTASDVVEALTPQSEWNHRTIKTMLNRLVKKRAIKFEAEGKRYLYSPAIARGAAVATQSRSFLARVFGGDITPMLAHFVEHEKLSPKEIAELRQLLERKDRRS